MSSDLGKQRVEHELFLRAFLSTKPPDRVATQLSLVTRDAHLDAGEVLFEAGQAPERLHFVAAGRMRLDGLDGIASVVDPGSLLGMLDASIPRPRTRTATALEPTHVLTLDFVDYLDTLEDNFGFAVDTLRSGAQSYCSLAERADPESVRHAPCGSSQAGVHEIDAVERVLVLQHTGLFRGAPAQALVQLAHAAEVRRWAAGARVFSSGDPISRATIVARGLIEAQHSHSSRGDRFGPHQIVTDLAVLATEVHEFSAYAKESSVTIELELEDLFDVAEDHFELWRSMLSYVASQRARLSELMSARELELGRLTL